MATMAEYMSLDFGNSIPLIETDRDPLQTSIDMQAPPAGTAVQVVLDAHTQPYHGTRPIPPALVRLARRIRSEFQNHPARLRATGIRSRGWLRDTLTPSSTTHFTIKGYFLAKSGFFRYWMDDRLFTGWLWRNLATDLQGGRSTRDLRLSRRGRFVTAPAVQRPGDPRRPTAWRFGTIMPDMSAPSIALPPPPGAVPNLGPPPPPPPQQPSTIVVLPVPAAQTNAAAATIPPQSATAPLPVIAPLPAAAPQINATATDSGVTASASNVANTDNNDEQNDNDDEEEVEAETTGRQESNNQPTSPMDTDSSKSSSRDETENGQLSSAVSTESPTTGIDVGAEGEKSDANKQPTSPMDTDSSKSDNGGQTQDDQPSEIGSATNRSKTDTGDDISGITKKTQFTAGNDPSNPVVVMIDIDQAAQAGPSGVPRTQDELDAVDVMVNPSFYQSKYEQDNPGSRETILERTKAALAEGTSVSQSSNTGSGGQAGGADEEEAANRSTVTDTVGETSGGGDGVEEFPETNPNWDFGSLKKQ